MIFQTHFKLTCSNIALRKVVIASSDGIQASDEFHQYANGSHVCIRTEVFRTIFNHLAGHKHTWKRLLLYANPWVAFIVFKQDVISRLIFFKSLALPTYKRFPSLS